MVDGSIRIDTKIDQTGVNKGLADIEKSCTSFVGVASGILAGIGVFEFGKSALKSTADIELAQAKLETLLGNADHAQSMINDIVKMADTTPYNSNDLIQAATTLKTFGVTADQIMPTLTALGNAAGGQAQNLQGVAYALGQTAAQGKMMTQDLYQFINAGVPLLDLLAKQLGKNKAEIKSMIEEGKVGYKEVNAALQEFYTGNGKYADLMAKAAQTLPGMYSTMQDAVLSFGRALVTIMEPAIKNFLQVVTAVFSGLANFFNGLSTPVQNVIRSFGSSIAIFTGIAAAVGVATTAFRLLFEVLRSNPFLLIISLVGTLIVKLMDLGDATQNLMSLTPAEYERAAQIYERLAKKQQEFIDRSDAAGAGAGITRMISDLQYYEGKLANLTPKDAEWTETVAKAEALSKILYNSRNLGFVNPDDVQKIEELKNKFEDMYKAKRKADAGDTGGAGGGTSAEELANRRKAVIEGLLSWEADQTKGANAGKIRELENQSAEELATIVAGEAKIEETTAAHLYALAAIERSGLADKDALIQEENDRYEAEKKGLEDTNHAIELEIERHNKQVALLRAEAIIKNRETAGENSWFQNFMLEYGDYDKDVYRVLKKSAHYDSLLAFNLGMGVSEETALGIDSGLHSVVSAVEEIGEAIAGTFAAVMEAFDIGAGVLDWIVGFNYADLETRLTKYINAIDSFFKNNLGSMTILFDLGAKMVEQLLAGLLSNLPAIVSSVGNLIQHISDYIITSGPEIIASTLTIVFDIVNKLVEKAPELFRAVLVAVVSFIENLAAKAETFTGFVGAAISNIINVAVAALPRLLMALVSLTINLLNAVVAQLPQIFTAVSQNLQPLADAISLAIPPLVIGLVNAVVPLAMALVNALPYIFEALINALPLIIEQLIYASPQIVAAIVKMIALIIVRVIPAMNIMVAKMFLSLHVAIIKWFYKIYLAAAVAIGDMGVMLWGYMQRAGKNVIDGFVSGILTAGSYIWQKVVSVFTGFIDAIKNFFGIHSPSTVFFNFGVDIIQGLINGLLSVGSGIGNILTSILSSAFSGIQSFLSSFASFGKAIMDNLLSGIKSVTGIESAITSAVQNALNFIKNIASSFYNAGEDIGKQIVDGINASLGSVGNNLPEIYSYVKDHITQWLPDIDWPDWNPFASGTKSAPGGWSVVGEKGPEMMNLKSGATVLSASDSIRAVMGALTPQVAAAPSASFSFSGEISAADVVIDGNTVGKIAFRYIDKQVKAAYGA